MSDEQIILNELKQGDVHAFSFLFNKYYKDLVLFGGRFLSDKSACEDIVQSIFLKLWQDKESIEINTSIKSFLLKSVQNGCLDIIRHHKIRYNYEENVQLKFVLEETECENYILYSDLKSHLDDALAQLPETYREAFELNRFDGLKYKEIAEKLHVSERTVEVRIGKALGLLRKHLKDFFILILSLLFS
jgi:RNA polymerase sigma-70 factor (ECF subfamily)